MANETNRFQAIIAHCKEYGFIFPSSEIYEGLQAVYDYGQWGSELKKNIKDYWWDSMTRLHENIVGIDAAIFMHPTTWKASGHVDNFNDPMIDNKESKKRYRVDHLVEGHAETMVNEGRLDEAKALLEETDRLLAKDDFDGLSKLIKTYGIKCPISNTANWTEIRQFNLMFSTQLDVSAEDDRAPNDPNELVIYKLHNEGVKSVTAGELTALGFKTNSLRKDNESDNVFKVGEFHLGQDPKTGTFSIWKPAQLYLRPETAQGIFVNFLNVQKTGRMKIPFGIAQIGKAFRNEITARQFIFRMREFEQMEMQFFIRPGSQKEWYEFWKKERLDWHLALGIPKEKYRFHDHLKLAHYADAACDIEFEFPIGFKELEGIHSRTDFDLRNHQQYSRKKQQYFDNDIDPSTSKPYGNYIPYVIETSIGLDRMFLAVLSHAYCEEDLSTVDKKDDRVVLKLPPKLAPVKLAVLPLVKKDGLPEIARQIMDDCKSQFRCFYEEKDTIGKRYRRMDAIGTPFCVTVDQQTKTDNSVTIRHRDSMEQERIPITEIKRTVLAKIG